MKSFFIIMITKILYRIGKLVGRGSTLPGEIALKLDKDILAKISYPENIIAVTGSNGKTSTVELITSVLEDAGLKVGVNREGANQTEGVVTMILNACTFGGKVKKDVLVIEVEERYSKFIFKHFKPNYYVLTNLYRDQLTRNGYPESVYDAIEVSLDDKMKLLLNSDDPLVSLYGYNKENVVYYGMAENGLSTKESTSMYNDGKFCPNCKSIMEYEFYHYNHIGSYNCKNCGHRRHEPQYEITYLNLEEGIIKINNEYRLGIDLKSMYNAYNILACFAVTKELGIETGKIVNSLNDYRIKNDRIQSTIVNGHNATVITTKNESSISYNQSMKYVNSLEKDVTIVIMIDLISRKYKISETSWLWDIDFDMLNTPHIKKIVLSGTYAYDIANRLDYTTIDKSIITVKQDIDEMMDYLKTDEIIGDIFVFTCFTDRDKFLRRGDK